MRITTDDIKKVMELLPSIKKPESWGSVWLTDCFICRPNCTRPNDCKYPEKSAYNRAKNT